MLEDQPPRPERQFRRKRDDDLYLVKKQLGYKSGKLQLPLGYIQGQKLDLELARLTQHVAAIRHFDELAIPFRAVATDIETGDEIVLSSGNLARAIRASMAVPGAFDAVELDGRLLVDGLVTNNVPVDVARKMGADVVIVVNVGTPLKARSEITSALAIIEQYSNIVGQQNVMRQLDTLRETDVYIQPKLGDISTSDFNRAAQTIGLGTDAARTEGAKLAKLAITSSGYSNHVATRGGRVGEAPIVGFVRIENKSKIGDDVLAHPFQALIGKPLDQRTLKRSIEELYGWNIFESIRYEIIEEKDKQGLLVHVRDKSWGPNYLQLGLALSTDFEGDSTWDIGVSLLKTALNRRAGELRLAAQIGESPLVLAELYQPLDVGLRYFITPQVFYDSRSFSRFEGGDEIEEFRVQRYGGGLAAGRVLGRWGEIRVGLRRYAGDGEVRIGDPATSDFDFDSAEAYLRLYYDTLDNRNWPRSGALSSLEWIESVESLGADSDFSQLLFTGGGAYSWGTNTVFGGFEFDYTADGVAPVQNRFRAGGFTKLSGFTQDQLSGQQVLLLRSGYYRRLGNVEWLPAYAGVSLEYGNVYEDRDDISLAPDEALLAGSVFVGMDTVLGPVYLGYGHAEQGNDSIYLYLGPVVLIESTAPWGGADAPASVGCHERGAMSRAVKGMGVALLTLVLIALSAWGVLAIYYSDLSSGSLKTALAAVFGLLGSLAFFAFVLDAWRWSAACAFVGAFLAVVAWWTTIEPSNDRDWRPEVARLPYATQDGNRITLHDIRDFEYRSETDFTPRYYDKTFDLDKLDSVDLLASYWMGPAIAHTS